jgi:signal transduction histidine kinase
MVRADTSAAGPVTAWSDTQEESRAAALITMLRLHWFTRLRWVFLLAAVVVLAIESFVVSDVQRPLGLVVVLAILGCVNLGWTAVSFLLFRRFRDDTSVRGGPFYRVEVFANAQVAVDLLLLTCILRFTGGVENPVCIFYLFHMAITSLLLKRWQAVLQGVWAVLLYGTLVVAEWQEWLTPHFGFLPYHDFGLYAKPEFVLASLVVVACGIFGTLYFTLHIARRLEQRERQLRQANADLRKSQTAIQDLQLRRSRFMQTAAHQLKSPLAVIQTLTDLIRNNIVPPEAIPGTCDKIVRRCGEGIQQVSELLTLARVQQADPARHRRSEADVQQVLSELSGRFRLLAEKKGIELNCQLPETPELHVKVDPQDLSDCVGNLIENAIKYTPGPGRVTVTVAVEFSPERSEEVSINVSDTGMGIAPEILTSPDGAPGHEPVFDAFRRGNNVIAAGIAGTGLGLSIVREIVEQAGGRIRVTSRPNEGSSFTVTFPAHRETAGQAPVRDTRASEIVIESAQSEGKQRSATDGTSC